FVLRAVAAKPLARHLHDPRSYHTRPPARAALRLSRLLDRRLQEDGLQGPLPAAAAAGAVRLAAGRRLGRNAVRAAGLSGDPPAQLSCRAESLPSVIPHPDAFKYVQVCTRHSRPNIFNL